MTLSIRYYSKKTVTCRTCTSLQQPQQVRWDRNRSGCSSGSGRNHSMIAQHEPSRFIKLSFGLSLVAVLVSCMIGCLMNTNDTSPLQSSCYNFFVASFTTQLPTPLTTTMTPLTTTMLLRQQNCGLLPQQLHRKKSLIYSYNPSQNPDDYDQDHNQNYSNATIPLSSSILGTSNITVLRNTNKKKSKEFKIVDNRDALPFQIQVHTPPDYHNTMTVEQTVVEKQKSLLQKKSDDSNSKFKKSLSSDVTNTLLSSVYRSNEDDDDDNKKKKTKRSTTDIDDVDTAVPLNKLGDYILDATTTTGDTIMIQDKIYRVIRHRCLYQYTQKHFVLCRKILEVKELNRYLSEQYIIQQFNL